LFLPEALLHAPATTVAAYFGIAFVAFRIFDMVKIGIRWVERTKWRGSIVWDDVLAGVYAGVATWLIARGFTFS
jgi:phosphatidylglycerophosphatase A